MSLRGPYRSGVEQLQGLWHTLARGDGSKPQPGSKKMSKTHSWIKNGSRMDEKCRSGSRSNVYPRSLKWRSRKSVTAFPWRAHCCQVFKAGALQVAFDHQGRINEASAKLWHWLSKSSEISCADTAETHHQPSRNHGFCMLLQSKIGLSCNCNVWNSTMIP